VVAVIFFAALLLLSVAIYIAVRTKTSAAEDLPENDQTEDYASMAATRYPGSEAFDAAFEKHIAPHTDKYFSTEIAGALSPNVDGSRRPSIIGKCEPMELLRLEPEPDNPVDPKAIAVKRVDGSQLGYLERRVASNLHRDAGEPYSWSAIFQQANRQPTTGEVVGAVIVLTRSRFDPDDV
jgi:hypothetical protein